MFPNAFELIIVLGYTVFAVWVVFFGGAEWLDDRLITAFLNDFWVDGPPVLIKIAVGVTWLMLVGFCLLI